MTKALTPGVGCLFWLLLFISWRCTPRISSHNKQHQHQQIPKFANRWNRQISFCGRAQGPPSDFKDFKAHPQYIAKAAQFLKTENGSYFLLMANTKAPFIVFLLLLYLWLRTTSARAGYRLRGSHPDHPQETMRGDS